MRYIFLLIVIIFLTSCSYVDEIRNDITGVATEDFNEEQIVIDSGSIEVYFCPRGDCGEKLVNLVKSSENINCAFYELNLKSIIINLEEKNYSLIIDNDNYDDLSYLEQIKKDNRSALMHNKFCVFDDNIISTGSFNPTASADTKQNNNLVIIESKTLARNYNDEFQSFLNDKFGRDEKVRYPRVILNNKILIENYFCPEDNCENHVYEVISKAKRRIYFMTFSFTSDKLGDLIVEKSREAEVKGIFEKTQASTQYSEYNKMKDANLNVILDKNPSFMHHKVFIVDDIVILGSYNPTSSGNTQNDENILIIYDVETADKFIEEFEYVWNL